MMDNKLKKYEIIEETAKSGQRIYKVNNYYLHSKYDPIREAAQFAERHYKKNYLHILFGVGSGYIAKALSEKMTEEEFLIVVEPIEWIADHHLEENVQVERCILMKGSDQELFDHIYEALRNTFGNRVAVMCSPNYDKICPSDYHALLKTVKDRIYIHQVHTNTLKCYSKEWQKNFTLNLFYAHDDVPLQCLKQFYNVPVVVASGGPSLTKQIPLLKKVRNHILLISSGSTINSLLQYDLEPDFVVTIDGGINNYRHFEAIELKQASIIYSLSNHEKIREKFKRRSFVFIPSLDERLTQYAQKLVNKKIDDVLGGASVAVFALHIAYMISNGPIALIGQDLAYTDNKTHAENNRNFMEINEAYIKERRMFHIKGYYGDQVLTDYAFLTMKHNFEKLLQTFSHPERIYNCTEGGAKLDGYQQLSFREFCNKYVDINTKVPMFAIDAYPHRDLQAWREFLVRVEQEIKLHDKVRRLAEEALLLLKSNGFDTRFDAKIVKKLDKIDQQLKTIFDEGIMAFITQPIVVDTFTNYLPKENETEQEMYQRVYTRSMDLYSRLQEAALDSKAHFMQLKEKIKSQIHSMDKREKDDGSHLRNST